MRKGTRCVRVAAAVALGGLALGVSWSRGATPADVETASEAQQDDRRSYPISQPAAESTADTAVIVRGAPQSSVAVYRTNDGALLRDDGLPFDDPVAYPAIVDGDSASSYFIAGVPCSSIETLDDSGPDCSPGGLSIARFDSKTGAFSTIEATGVEGTTPYVRLLGVADQGLIVQLDGELYSLPVEGGELTSLGGAAPLEDGLTLACLVGQQVVAISQSYGPGDSTPEPGEFVEEPYQPYVPFEAAVLDLRSGEWSKAGGPAATYDSNDTFEYGCVDRGLVAIPSEKPMLEASPYVTFVFDAARSTWTEAPPPPREFLAAAPAASDGSHLALSVSSDFRDTDTAVMIFDGEANTWSAEQEGGAGATASVIALTGDSVVSLAAPEAKVQVTEVRE